MNQKRDQVRLEIRKAQKLAIFQQIRTQMLLDNQSTKLNPIQQLKNRRNEHVCLEILDSQIKNNKGHTAYQIIYSMIDNGCFYIIIENLKTGKFVQETLRLITSILSKQDISVGGILVSRGLIQLILKYISNINYFKYCCNILGNLAIQDNNFAQLMMENKVYHDVIEVIRTIQIANINQFSNQLQFGIWSIINMVSKMDQYQNLNPHLTELISFINYFFQNQLYLEETLQLLYQIAKCDLSSAKNSITVAHIQKLLSQVSLEAAHLRNLLYVIDILSPIMINYRPLYLLIVLRPKLISVSLRIMTKLVGHPDIIKPIANDINWIKKLCFLVKNQQDKINLLKIMAQLPDNEQTWEIVKQFLEPKQSIRYQLEGLRFLNEYIKRSISFDEAFLKFLEQQCILHYLQILSECKNTTVQKKAQQILEILNNA